MSRNSLLHGLGGLACCLVAFWLGLALITVSHRDPSWLVTHIPHTPSEPSVNAAGELGSWLAGTLLFSVGLWSWWLVVGLLLLSLHGVWRLRSSCRGGYLEGLLGLFCVLFSGSVASSLFGEQPYSLGALVVSVGGTLGSLGAQELTAQVGLFGAGASCLLSLALGVLLLRRTFTPLPKKGC